MKPEKAIIPFLLLSLLRCVPSEGQEYVSSSVLSQGKWVRIAVTEPGVYRLDYSQINAMGIGDPASVALYGNNTGQLSFYNDGSAPDDLVEIGILTEKGTDNIFNEGDFILFYGEGTHRWKYNTARKSYDFFRNYYSDTAYYFITSRSGQHPAVITEQVPPDPYTHVTSSTDVFFRYENEKNNIIKSGREWYQMVVSDKENTIDPGFTDLITGERINYRIRVLARADENTMFTFRQGGSALKYITVPQLNMADINGVYANIVTMNDSCFPASVSPVFSLTYSNNGNLSATGYIDYIDLIARANLVYNDRMLFITEPRTVGESNITRFSITSSTPLKVWDVTDPLLPRIMATTFAGTSNTFIAATDSLRKFVAFDIRHVLEPVIINGLEATQNLHGLSPAEMIIISHPVFVDYADKLARLHFSDDGIRSIIVTPRQIYNEFSGGIPDAAAIRNFVKMIWEKGKSSSSPLKYLLLFGDGSYENKTSVPHNPAFIPTWQSANSHIGVLSFTSDDFYGLLDDGEGEADGYLDIGIGRLPVSDTTEAGIVTRKITSYLKNPEFGSWRNVMCMVADDEDGNMHMTDAEAICETAKTFATPVVIEKIYLDAYRQVTSVSGDSYPDAVQAVNNNIAAGCLIMNYVGHGSETGLAHERVIRTDNINSWDNGARLPLFITATCEFSRFDDVEVNPVTGEISEHTSAGEMVLLNPNGGGIALMSTTRVVYSAPNFTLNNSIYKYAFADAPDKRSMRLGDIIRLAKVNSGTGMNKRNFLLLGDPALRLAWPKGGSVVTDSINHVSVEMEIDTIKALSLITVSGHIEDTEGNIITDFHGKVEPVVYDKASTLSTLANDGGTVMTFPLKGNVIFNGSTEVTNGFFSFSFIVPLDINYSFGEGRITYYAYDEADDLNGTFSDLIVGGFSDITIDDKTGPEIQLFMNDTLFIDGGITDTAPTLLARISDKSGINATGAGIGHDIIAWLDDDQSGAIILNQHFRNDLGDHTSGTLLYPLLISEHGEHTLTLRAWDNVNNPSLATLHFVVETNGMFRLTDLLCYPNPAESDLWFSAGHNRPDEEILVIISIFNTSGSKLRVIKENITTSGYRLPDIWWDGCDDSGGRLARGLYIWRIEASSGDGERATASGKVIIL